jgi:hypothetical protein
MTASNTREIVGFLCRWCLLAGTGVAVVLVAGASVRATVSVADDVRSELTMSDWVARPATTPRDRVHLWGCLTPPARVRDLQIALAAAAGRRMTLLRTEGEGCLARFERPKVGTTRLVVRGLPYSAVAFQSQTCRVVCVGPGRRAFLVDARMALALRRDQPGPWRACLRQMQARGEVVLFHPGPKPAYLRCRRELCGADCDLPLLFHGARDLPLYTLRRALADLGRARGARRPDVVTADVGLARQAARMRCTAHLVSSGAAGGKTPPRVRRHESVAKFKVSLLPQPIPNLR